MRQRQPIKHPLNQTNSKMPMQQAQTPSQLVTLRQQNMTQHVSGKTWRANQPNAIAFTCMEPERTHEAKSSLCNPWLDACKTPPIKSVVKARKQRLVCPFYLSREHKYISILAPSTLGRHTGTNGCYWPRNRSTVFLHFYDLHTVHYAACN